jgi:NADPH:quinone reductase-like Zn-dependent oxidoreductase
VLADAAALPSVVLTAWQALFEHAELKPGQSILIDGGGGAVGGLAVQFAKQAGAIVTATAGVRSRDRVRSYGADRVVDYATDPFARELAGLRFDVVLHLVPTGPHLAPIDPEVVTRLVDLVADGGAFFSTTITGPENPGRGVRAGRVFVRNDPAQLAELVAGVDAGELKLHVAERLPLTDLATVHARAAAGQLAGKTVLTP